MSNQHIVDQLKSVANEACDLKCSECALGKITVVSDYINGRLDICDILKLIIKASKEVD